MFNKKIMFIFPVTFFILSIFVFAQGPPPGPPWGDGGSNGDDTNTSETSYDSMLKIIEVIVDIDNEKDKITTDGEKIRETAKEQSEIEFEVNVKNNFEDKKIKNIKIEVIIENIDDGEDLEETSTSFDLEPGKSDSKNIKFKLPLRLDDGNYNVKIHVEGKDEGNALHENNWLLKLEVKKDKHKVRITEASLSPSRISCSQSSNLMVKVLNLGSEEETVRIEVKNVYLGIDLKEESIILGEGIDDDAEYEKTFKLNIIDAEEGTYTINIKASYYDNRFTSTKDAILTIDNCIGEKIIEEEDEVLVKTVEASSQETTGKAQQITKPETKTISSPLFKPSLINILVIGFGFLIFLVFLVVVMIKLRSGEK